jgi:hypothetical protein
MGVPDIFMEALGFGNGGGAPPTIVHACGSDGVYWVVVNMGDPADFSDEYVNCRVRIETSIGIVVEGVLVEASRYWFKLKSDKGVVYVNKAHIVLVTPVAGQHECRGGRGG